MGLLPGGQKIPGQGNVFYFPDDTLLRLWLIALLMSEMNLSLSDISRYPWPEVEGGQGAVAPNAWSGDFLLNAKKQCQRAKHEAMSTVIKQLVKELGRGEGF